MRVKETSVYNSLIIDSIKEMVGLAKKGNFTAKQELNGVTVLVSGDSDANIIFRDQQRAQSGYIDKNVGPHPNPVLTDEEKASDKRIEAKNERKRQKEQAEYETKATAHREKIEAKLIDAPGIAITDKAAWRKFQENNRDGYGGAVVTYSERWARLMQVHMAPVTTPTIDMLIRLTAASGGGWRSQAYAQARNEILSRKLGEIASNTSHEADLEGITGFQYGCGVSTLAQCWKYGEHLRRWHNRDIQIGDEGDKANESGGVLNPALLSIG